MTRTTLTTGLLAVTATSVGLAGTLSAQTVAEQTGLSIDEAIELALAEVPGDVFEIAFDTDAGATIFEIGILSDADEEVTVEVAAATGEILEIEAERDCDKDHDDEDDDEEDQDDDEDDDDDDEEA